MSQKNPTSRKFLRRLILIFAGLFLVSIILFIVSNIWIRDNQHNESVSVFAAKRGPLTISVTESGTINNREKVVVKSEVEGKTTILFLISEGTRVREGDLLIKLDTSHLEDEKTQQQITVLNAEAAYVHARENMAVTKSQAESDIAKAKLDYDFAQEDLKKYLEGEYPQELQQVEAEITVAKEELQRAEEKLAWSKRLYSEGYITLTELQADELVAERKNLDVKLAEGKLNLLKDFTHKRKLKELRSNLEQTKQALDRIKRKAVADNVQAEADLKAKESELNRQQWKLKKISDQIAKCKITAPVDGMVVYATTGKSKKSTKGPMEEGLEVQEGQELIYLPTTSLMMAEINIPESSLIKVRDGMPARITVDAAKGKVFYGRVEKIDPLPDPTMAWLNPDMKVYPSEVYIDGDASALRPGMTCRVEIIVKEYSDIVYVPVQSVVRIKDRPVIYVVESDGPKRREVEIGMDNNRMIAIVKGLSKDEKVLLTPPLAPSEAPLLEKRPDEPVQQTKSARLTSTKGPVSGQKDFLIQKEEKGVLEETPTDVNENEQAQRK